MGRNPAAIGVAENLGHTATLKSQIDILIARLENIAHKNRDTFEYRVIIEPKNGQLYYDFQCLEAADHHVFVSGEDTDFASALTAADAAITEALQVWGYKE